MPPIIKTLYSTPWLSLKEVAFTDATGSEKQWSYVTRPNITGAVCIIAQTNEPDPHILLIEQFRPATNRRIIEFPAGLIDPGESPESTALRELQEETGWSGTLIHLSPPCYSTAGLSDESIHFAHVQLTTKGSATLESDEEIQPHLVPLKELSAFLEKADFNGLGIDVKVWAYSLQFDR